MRAENLVSELFKHLPKASVMTSDDVGYDAGRRVWNGMFDRYPVAIVFPETATEISAIVKLMATTDLPLAVRCGGHSIPGLSTCDGGVIIDLSRMTNIRVDPEARIAVVCGGALLGDLDKAGEPYGLITPAGVISHTGVGGLTLGGGMGWTSRRFGMTVDSLLSVEIVTANGDIVRASPTSEPELFWGLRGGGGNFGVVTEFTFRMHPVGKVTAGHWMYNPDHGLDILHNFAKAAALAPRSVTVALNVTATYISIAACHSGDDPYPESLIRPFGTLGSATQAEMSERAFVEFQSQHDEIMGWGRRIYNRGGFVADISPAVATAMLDHVRETPSPDCEIYVLQLGGAITDIAEDATAYSGRDAGFYWIVQPVWDDPALDEACLAWGRKGARTLAALSMERNYVNEQGEVGNNVARQAYGAEKYRRLAQLKARFDPHNLFRLNQNIRPEV